METVIQTEKHSLQDQLDKQMKKKKLDPKKTKEIAFCAQ